MIPKKAYLGDSVYASFDGWHIVLTTENGYGPSNTIALEGSVLSALMDYVKQIKENKNETQDKKSGEE